KILVGNLDYGVTEADLRELFTQVGPVKRATLNFGPNGRSKGSGEVIFRSSAHAALAVERYHGVTLDGRTMKIEVAYNPMAVPMMMPTMMPGAVMQGSPAGGKAPRSGGRANGAGRQKQQNGPANGGKGRRGGHKGGRGGDREKRPDATKESLDADLDTYM
ncbi:RNA-binding domain-containing protein, partial [Linderina pennispora]